MDGSADTNDLYNMLEKISSQLETLLSRMPAAGKISDRTTTKSFAERLRMLIGNVSARSFAADLKISASALHQYLHGRSDPTRAVLSLIASKTGANMQWLVDGTGPMLKKSS